MHKQVVYVGLSWLHVRLGSQSNESFFEEKDAQRIHAVKEHVDAQIKLKVLEQEGVTDVSLGNAVLRWVNIHRVSHDIYASSLAQVLWLDDERFFSRGPVLNLNIIAVHHARILFKLCLELHVLHWEHVRLGKDVVLFGKTAIHFHQTTC